VRVERFDGEVGDFSLKELTAYQSDLLRADWSHNADLDFEIDIHPK